MELYNKYDKISFLILLFFSNGKYEIRNLNSVFRNESSMKKLA